MTIYCTNQLPHICLRFRVSFSNESLYVKNVMLLETLKKKHHTTDQVQMTSRMCGSVKSLWVSCIWFNERENSQKLAKKKVMTACCEVRELFGLSFQGNIFESSTALFHQKVTFLKIAKQFWATHWKKKIFEDRRFNFAKSFVALNAPWHAPSPLIERLSSERSFRRARV